MRCFATCVVPRRALFRDVRCSRRALLPTCFAGWLSIWNPTRSTKSKAQRTKNKTRACLNIGLRFYGVWFTIHRSLTNMNVTNPTPMLRQYQELKQQHPGTLLFFRLGDFYELFLDDAVIGARELQITLTARHKERGDPIPMCGVPHHSAASYIARLVRKGYRVAICEQTEEATK